MKKETSSIQKIEEVASKMGISKEAYGCYGTDKAKLFSDKIQETEKGKLILVTATSPTPYGEGKTTMSIGLHDALCYLGKKSLLTLREPSLGPVFGLKGGATGGGKSKLAFMEDINLHFTGDFHAITSANNLLCAAIDNHLYYGNALNINPETITFSRCLDINDRALRSVTIGLSSPSETVREEHFTITAASEIMALFCLASDFEDLRKRLDQIIIAYTYDAKPVYAKDLAITGSMMALLKEAFYPNLVQTLEGNPVIVHGGPFANIAHGCNSLIATKTALKLSDYVITEAGFGSDLGAEKFFDIKCRIGNLTPSVVVLVTTLKSLKYNSGMSDILKEDKNAVQKGLCNLKAHICNLQSFQIPIVVAFNRYQDDTESEIQIIRDFCNEMNVLFEESSAYTDGKTGSISLAKIVISLAETESSIHYQYELQDSIEEKIEKLAHQIYHAKTVVYSKKASEKIKQLSSLEFQNYPICVSKTPYSLSDNPKKLGFPKDYELYVSDIKLYAGAGFITVFLGDVMTMPGLSKHSNYENIDVVQNSITGLF